MTAKGDSRLAHRLASRILVRPYTKSLSTPSRNPVTAQQHERIVSITFKSFVLGATFTITRRPFGHKTSTFDIFIVFVLLVVVDTGSDVSCNRAVENK